MRYSFVSIRHFVPALFITIFAFCGRSHADPVDRDGIASHLDQLQNMVLRCGEIKTITVDPHFASIEPKQFEEPSRDLSRIERANLTFAFLNGNALYMREYDSTTAKYWREKGLPSILTQTQTISSTGKIEELTVQRSPDGREPVFGGIHQLSTFSPDITIDIALGLRLLEARRWTTKADLSAMFSVESNDPNVVALKSQDGAGHIHELHFDRRLLYALTYYRCENAQGAAMEIINSNFQRHGNVYVPGEIVRTSKIPNADGSFRHPFGLTIKVLSAAIDGDENTPSKYAIVWPAHMQLFDARVNDRVDVGDTARQISDDEIRMQLDVRDIERQNLRNLTKQRLDGLLGRHTSSSEK